MTCLRFRYRLYEERVWITTKGQYEIQIQNQIFKFDYNEFHKPEVYGMKDNKTAAFFLLSNPS